MKRLYRASSVLAEDGQFGVMLDQSRLKTPSGKCFALPTLALAEAVAEEWRAQGKTIEPSTMTLTQYCFTALDRLPAERDRVIDILAGFAQSDLLCYRAPHPADLAERQTLHWSPWLDWARSALAAPLLVTDGLLPLPQPAESLARLRAAVGRRDDWTLSALQSLVPALGSLILGLAVVDAGLDGEQAFQLAQLDEAFQNERWGTDVEAQARQQGLRRDIDAAVRYLRLLKPV